MTCPACGAPLPDSPVFPGGSVQCECGAAAAVPMTPIPHEEEPAPTSVYREPLCPRCRVPLELREEGGVVLTACPHGHGLFVARPALEALEPESLPAIRKLDAGLESVETSGTVRSARLCPTCDRTMREETVEATGVQIDVCPMHGTWFDSGELSTVVRAAPPRDAPS